MEITPQTVDSMVDQILSDDNLFDEYAVWLMDYSKSGEIVPNGRVLCELQEDQVKIEEFARHKLQN